MYLRYFYILYLALYSAGQIGPFRGQSLCPILKWDTVSHRTLFFFHKIHKKSSLNRVVTEIYISSTKFLGHQDSFGSFFLSNLLAFSEN